MRKTIRHFPYLILLPLVLLEGCSNCIEGYGERHEEDRLIPFCQKILLDCSVTVYLRPLPSGEKEKVVVKAQPTLMPLITTRIQDDILKVSMVGCSSTTEPIEVFVYSHGFMRVENSGSGSIFGEYEMASDVFEIVNNGSGSVQLRIESDQMVIQQNGSGGVHIDGVSRVLNLTNNGSGECEASGLKTNEAKVNLNGSGAVSIFATGSADMTVHGSGSIQYGGKPSIINKHNDGSGEILEIQ